MHISYIYEFVLLLPSRVTSSLNMNVHVSESQDTASIIIHRWASIVLDHKQIVFLQILRLLSLWWRLFMASWMSKSFLQIFCHYSLLIYFLANSNLAFIFSLMMQALHFILEVFFERRIAKLFILHCWCCSWCHWFLFRVFLEMLTMFMSSAFFFCISLANSCMYVAQYTNIYYFYF